MSASGQAPLLQLTGVTRRFGLVHAVRQVHLTIRDGEFIVIFGPNGAGKTTLLQMIAALLKPSEGTIRFGSGTGGRASVGYVSHQSLLYGDLSGYENLLFFGRLYSLPQPRQRALQMLDRMGLSPVAERPVGDYSRGMKQRLTLGRALIHDPQLLLLDEPYTGLDQHGARLLNEVLRELKEEGRTVLMVTHNLRQGIGLADRFLVQHHGCLVEERSRTSLTEAELEELYFRVVESRGA